jgi:hypothetical protein
MPKEIKGMQKGKRRVQEIELSRKVSVDVLEVPASGLHFSVTFSFDLSKGTSNFYNVSELVDQQINNARREILEKVANKLGVKVNFEE